MTRLPEPGDLIEFGSLRCDLACGFHGASTLAVVRARDAPAGVLVEVSRLVDSGSFVLHPARLVASVSPCSA